MLAGGRNLAIWTVTAAGDFIPRTTRGDLAHGYLVDRERAGLVRANDRGASCSSPRCVTSVTKLEKTAFWTRLSANDPRVWGRCLASLTHADVISHDLAGAQSEWHSALNRRYRRDGW